VSGPGRLPRGRAVIPLIIGVLLCGLSLAAGGRAEAAGQVGIRSPDLSGIAPIVQAEIAAGRIPGAVVLVGLGDRILYRQAFGNRNLGDASQAMTVDTVFDLASLTKVVVTTTAVLQLAERRRLELDAPAARYWPAFGANGKQSITIRELLAHTSGLPAGVDPGRGDPWRQIERLKPLAPAGREVRYSDVNFLVLGRIVEQASGESLATYAERHVQPALDWRDSGFLAADTGVTGRAAQPDLLRRVAPSRTERDLAAETEPNRPASRLQDPLARLAGGVAGHAGLFGTADDLARFAREILAGGGKLLGPASVGLLFSLQTPPGTAPRGLGWRLEPPLASNRAALPAVGAISHLGYTGTGLWLDRSRGAYVIVLSNRTSLRDGDASPLRARVVAVVGDALGPVAARELADRYPEARERIAPFVATDVARPVRTGIDVLEDEQFRTLRGKRVGLLTHRSGVDSLGRRTADMLRAAPGVTLAALFSPEHGLDSLQEGQVRNGTDALTGVPVYSLYGASKRPAPEMLRGLDAVVVDLQDAGTRFYTYATTLAYLMEVAGAEGIPVYVLDRPNPLTATTVQGPMLDMAQRGFTGYWPLPTRHGMTLGELARLFAGEADIAVELHVLAMRNFRRTDWYDDSGLPWLAPSPNLPSVVTATLYPGVGMIEGAPVSVGRGTATPFQVVGAPWIDAHRLADAMNALRLPGARFAPTSFTPASATHAGRTCQGVRVEVTDRDVLDSPALGVALAHTLHRLYPKDFQVDRILGNLGSASLLEDIKAGESLRSLLERVDREVESFGKIRARYLLY
jgi:uncharacterized protein YbbC (DUF1343 family)/CubicO group peptidase (beta-lactamase class C family)